MEIIAVALLAVPVPVVVGFCRTPSLSKLGRQAKITGACAAAGAASYGLAGAIHSERTRLTRTPQGLRINQPVPFYLDEAAEGPLQMVSFSCFVGGVGNGAWTAGQAARCLISAAIGAATGSGGPRV